MTMLFHDNMIVIFLALFIPTCISFENTLRLYDSFAEIHQLYDGPLRFQQNDWNNIKQETILLRPIGNDNINDTDIQFERRILRINTNMTGNIILSLYLSLKLFCLGKKVLVRRYPEHQDPIPCEIIHEDYNYALVRSIETGRYFKVQSHLIEYSDVPQSSTIYEVSFYPPPSNNSFSVSYIMKNIRWQPRYTLQTYTNRSVIFQIIVDIINSSPFFFQFNQTHLMTGDIDLTFGSQTSASLINRDIRTKTDIDYSGIRLFTSINNSLTIDPYSILTLPIVSPDIQVKASLTYTLVINIPSLVLKNLTSVTTGKHKLQRLYQISNSSLFLPTGHLMLYDSSSSVLTGEWHLPTLAEFEKYEFKLGEDPDTIIEYNRTTTNDQKSNSSLITTNVLIQNYKYRSIIIRFKSICDSSMVCLYYDDKARSLGSRLNYELNLKAKSEVVFSFTTIRLV